MPYLVEPAVEPARLAGPQPEIVAGDLTLRRWLPGDAEQLMAAYADPDIKQWNLRRLDSRKEAEQLIAIWKRGWRRHAAASWAVVPSTSPERIIGQAGFRSLYLVDGMAEVSYWITPGQRRRGVATRATRMLSDWAIEELGLHRLELVHSVRNPGSCRVAQNAGFEIEGVKRELQQHADGWHDMCLHSRIRKHLPSASAVRPQEPFRIRLAARLGRSVRSGDAAGRSVGLQFAEVGAARG